MDVIKEAKDCVKTPRNSRGVMFGEWLWSCDITHLEISQMPMWKKRELLATWMSGALPDERFGSLV